MNAHHNPDHAPTAKAPLDPTSTSPTPRQLWTRARGVLLAAALLLIAGLVLAMLQSGERYGALDPRSTELHGTRAVAELLRDEGVSVSLVTTTAEAEVAVDENTTLLLTRPQLLGTRQLTDLRAAYSDVGGRTVLLGPGPEQASILLPEVRAANEVELTQRSPECTARFATRAGSVTLGGFSYATSAASVDACYLSQGLPTLVRVPDSAGPGDTVVAGAGDFLHNERLDERGNASLALQLLGSRPHVVWYLPSLADPAAEDGNDESLLDLLPAGWIWGSVQLAIAVVLAALWRARRLGPLVTENLPIVVHASETTEGRARLYQQTKSRERAADVLRSAIRHRLATHLGVPATQADTPEVLAPAIMAHTSTLQATAGTESDVRSLLFGATPPNDDALMQLVSRLDALDQLITAPPTDKDRLS